MKVPHLCWVVDPPERFAPLVAAARELGLSVGWLQLGPFSPAPELEPAARAGVSRAVAVGGGASLALRSMRGEPVLADPIRGHFLGCRLLLLFGDPARPGVRVDQALRPGRLWRAGPGDDEHERWKLVTADGRERLLSTLQLAERLRRPRL